MFFKVLGVEMEHVKCSESDTWCRCGMLRDVGLV